MGTVLKFPESVSFSAAEKNMDDLLRAQRRGHDRRPENHREVIQKPRAAYGSHPRPAALRQASNSAG